MPTWLLEILASLGAAAITLMIFAAALAFGIFVTIKIGGGNPWVGVAAAVAVLLFVALPLRLWFVTRR
jgi:hypothetical protein